MNKNDYNFIASYYVFIRTFVFGAKTEKAYEYYLNYIQPGSSALIVGGGAGKIISNENLSDKSIRIDYVDSSKKMIEIARKRKSNAQVNFICNNILTYNTNKKYDVIIFPFILDVFNEQNLVKVIAIATDILAENGLIIVSDFAPPSGFFEKALLRLMFLFFKITTNIESNYLLKIESCIDSTTLQKEARIDFHKGFIFSAIYKNVEKRGI